MSGTVAAHRGHHQPADRRAARATSTTSTGWSSTPPSAPARSTPTTASSARACSSTSARSSTPTSQEKPLVDRAARDQRRPADPRARSRPRAEAERRRLSRRSPSPPMTRDRTALPAPPGARVVLGVSGGIAAYKACEVLRRLTESGHEVTRRAHRGGPAVRRRGHLGGAVRSSPSPPTCGTTSRASRTSALGREADLVLVVPATADLHGPRRARPGRRPARPAPCSPRAARCVLAPAMHTEMWEHPATRANVATLRERGVVVLDPAVGRLTGADSGPGRLPEPAEIVRDAAARARPRRRGRRGRPPTWPVGASSSPPAAPASRSTRSASWATAPAGGRATRWPQTAAARGAPGPVLVAANVACPTRPASRSCGWAPPPSSGRPSLGRRRGRRRRHGGGGGRLPAGRRSPCKIKKDAGEPEPIALDRNPDVLRRPGRRSAANRPVVGRVRRRDRRRRGRRPRARPAPSWPRRAATCWWSTGSGTASVRGRRQRRGRARRGRQRDRRAARPERGPRRRRVGPGRSPAEVLTCPGSVVPPRQLAPERALRPRPGGSCSSGTLTGG